MIRRFLPGPARSAFTSQTPMSGIYLMFLDLEGKNPLRLDMFGGSLRVRHVPYSITSAGRPGGSVGEFETLI